MMRNTNLPTILFGAFDRHNFGDLLFPHVVTALLGDRNYLFAGLAERDLRSHGGHRVHALAKLAEEWSDQPVDIIHAGGELLTCDAWQAAVMLLPPEQAQDINIRLHADLQRRNEWAQQQLGTHTLAPYTVSRELFPCARKLICNAVGGVDLDERAPNLRSEVVRNLKAADAVGVRDLRTQAVLTENGIAARLMPDPAVMVEQLFGARIRSHARQHEVAQIGADLPRGYVAVQFSTDFDDDKTLAQIAAQLDQLARASHCGIVFFRAGAAPWHDDLRCYERTAAHMKTASRIFTSLDVWDICALIANSRGYLGSSLHGRIVAMAFGLPRLNLLAPGQSARTGKQSFYAASWEAEGLPVMGEVQDAAREMGRALEADRNLLQRTAAALVAQYRQGFAALCAALA